MTRCDYCKTTDPDAFIGSYGAGQRWSVTIRFPRDRSTTRVADQGYYDPHDDIDPVVVSHKFCDTCSRNVGNNLTSAFIMCSGCSGVVDLRRGNGADTVMAPPEDTDGTRICYGCRFIRINRVPNCIQSYTADATDLLTERLRPNKIYSGIEIEVGFDGGDITRNKRASEVLEKVGKQYAICKKDSSISGFEIVSIPTTLDVHAAALKSLCSDVPQGLLSDDDDECGIHVHLSKAPIPACTLVKLQYFLNASVNRRFIEKIAGRANNAYSKLETPSDGFKDYYKGCSHNAEWGAMNKLKLYKLGRLDRPRKFDILRYNYDRRSALNLRKAPTIEFRIFQSSLNYVKVMSYLEFCYAAVNFCNVSPMRKYSLNASAFCSYVKKSEYKNLKLRIAQIEKGNV